jgi:hypothetical protein
METVKASDTLAMQTTEYINSIRRSIYNCRDILVSRTTEGFSSSDINLTLPGVRDTEPVTTASYPHNQFPQDL